MAVTDEMFHRLEDKYEKQQGNVNRLSNVAWVLGTLALIFGAFGGWGLNAIVTVQQEISILKVGVDAYKKEISEITEKRKKELAQYSDSLRQPFNNEIVAVHKRISGIKLSEREKRLSFPKYEEQKLTYLSGYNLTDEASKKINIYNTLSICIPGERDYTKLICK